MLAFTLVLAAVAAQAAAPEVIDRAKECGIQFVVPPGWKVADGSPAVDRTRARCVLSLRPPDWDEIRSKSDWGLDDPAVTLAVLDLDLEKALDWAGFERDDTGSETLMGGYGSRAGAKPYRLGTFTGFRAMTYYRRFWKPERPIPEGESRVISADIGHIVVARQGCPSLVVEWLDEPRNLEAVVETVLESVQCQRR